GVGHHADGVGVGAALARGDFADVAEAAASFLFFDFHAEHDAFFEREAAGRRAVIELDDDVFGRELAEIDRRAHADGVADAHARRGLLRDLDDLHRGPRFSHALFPRPEL